jgi:hypothetical protein
MNKELFFKIAGVKDMKSFYAKYPSEEAFMTKHKKDFEKAQRGAKIVKAQDGTKKSIGDPSGAQEMVGQVGPWGSIISKASQIGTGITDKSHNKFVYAAGKSMLDPAAAWTNKDLNTTDRILGGLNPIYGGFKAFQAKEKKEAQKKKLDELLLQADESGKLNPIERKYNRPEKQSQPIYDSYGIDSNIMEDGGNINPQAISQFGGHKLSDLLKRDEMMDTLRTGGNIRQNSAFNGELKTYGGGGVEEVSRNPYSIGKGTTGRFFGDEHSDPSGGIDTGYGSPDGVPNVKTETGEYVAELNDGGTIDPNTGEPSKSAIIYGNLNLSREMANLIGKPEFSGKKFKNIMEKFIVPEEQKAEKMLAKSGKLAAEADDTSFGSLTLNTAKAYDIGGKFRFKDADITKNKLADIQQTINDTAEEYGLIADDLAKGNIKYAKNGGKFTAQNGKPLFSYNSVIPKGTVSPSRSLAENFQLPVSSNVSNPQLAPIGTRPTNANEKGKFPWMEAINSAISYLRPSDTEKLDYRQTLAERLAMAEKEEPVQAQLYYPELGVPYDISMQDQLNEITAQKRSAEKLTGYNPTVQSMIASQAYGPRNEVLANQFRANQAMKDKTYGENRQMLNQTRLQNLGILDTQSVRQAQAKSNTKALQRDALSSISAKYLQNQLENRQLATYENLYNYRFDDKFRKQNWNPLMKWNMEGSGDKGSLAGLFDDFSPEYEIDPETGQYEVIRLRKKTAAEKKSNTVKYKNGGLVRAIHNL